MSGHNKWSTIKHKKGAADAKRGKIFTKLIKEITVAAKNGGGDPDSNAALRSAILKARLASMPKDNIEKGIKRGIGGGDTADYIELVYEGYASGGVGLIIETLTDNKNRTGANVKAILSKNGGQLAATGAVSYQFKRVGLVNVNADENDEDKVIEVALEAGAADVVSEGGLIEIETDPANFEAVINALEAAGIKSESADITMLSDTPVTLDVEKTKKVLELIEKLEDDDDVQRVSSNLNIPADMNLD
ncbi:MAG: YebC/PmpR family DNA-binding transcriptional regulator [Spirochaetaceae bacterium]|nr:YebC/PmpR family DNA-binding transcriptional regulator [Spirochaetaceae bacterium]